MKVLSFHWSYLFLSTHYLPLRKLRTTCQQFLAARSSERAQKFWIPDGRNSAPLGVCVCVIVHTQLYHIIPLFKLVNMYFSWCNTSSINNNCPVILYFFLATEASPRLNLSASNGAKKRTSPDPCRTGQNLVRENDGDSFSKWRGWHPWLWYKNCEMKPQNKTVKCQFRSNCEVWKIQHHLRMNKI